MSVLPLKDEIKSSDFSGGVHAWILDQPFQPALGQAIERAFRAFIVEAGGVDLSWAVCSSATAEDLPEAAFAGHQETFLNVQG